MGGTDERRILAAMLRAVGELGYASATVQDAVAQTGLSRAAFYRHFGSKEECFATAHGNAIDALAAEMRAACRAQTGWIDGMREALTVALRSAADDPARARALLLEVRAARGTALAKYSQVTDSLARDVDLARREAESSHYSPSLLTAKFIVATVEFTLGKWLVADHGARASSLLPGLLYNATLYYFGEDAARRAARIA